MGSVFYGSSFSRAIKLLTNTGPGIASCSELRKPAFWKIMVVGFWVSACLCYHGGDPVRLCLCAVEPTDYNTTDTIVDDSNSRIEFERSYQCDSSQTVKFNNTLDIYPILYVSQLQVQAFHFSNQTKFDNGKSNCLTWSCMR